MKTFSYEKEKQYYSNWPKKVKPYLHLEKYLLCWLNPDKIFKGKKVLDVGAGECEYSRLIAEKYEPKEIIACELFEERMKLAKENNKNPTLKFIVGDCFNLPFPEKSFDVVFGSLVLHQLPNLEDALKEIKRVLNKNGLYVGFEPNPFNIVTIYRHFLKTIHQTNISFGLLGFAIYLKKLALTLKYVIFMQSCRGFKTNFYLHA